jgi:hypothetical protein
LRPVALLAVASCAAPVSDGDDTPDPGSCSVGDEQVVLVSELRFAREVEGRSVGFDLDGAVSESGGATGCGAADYTSPDGTSGVDNALAALFPVLEATEAGALEPLIAAAISEGGLMIVLRWSGIDDPLDDTCVTVESLGGVPPVATGSDDRLLPFQTIDLDPTAGGSLVEDGVIAGGLLEAGPFEITVPFRVLDADIDLTLLDVQVRLEPDGEGRWRGLVGGGVAVQQIVDTIAPLGIDPAVKALVGPLLGNAADLAPDENGACTRISAQIEVTAVPVFLFETNDPA